MIKQTKPFKNKLGYIMVTLTFLAVFAVLSSQSRLAAAPKVGTGIGDKVPDFTLADLNGVNMKLSDVVQKNKVTLINFWGIWCPYCVREIPELVRFYNRYHKQKVEILGIDVGDNPGEVSVFVRKNRMDFPILLDKGRSVDLYRVSGLPTTVIVDRNGRIADIIVGATTLDALSNRVDKILKEK